MASQSDLEDYDIEMNFFKVHGRPPTTLEMNNEKNEMNKEKNKIRKIEEEWEREDERKIEEERKRKDERKREEERREKNEIPEKTQLKGDNIIVNEDSYSVKEKKKMENYMTNGEGKKYNDMLLAFYKKEKEERYIKDKLLYDKLIRTNYKINICMLLIVIIIITSITCAVVVDGMWALLLLLLPFVVFALGIYNGDYEIAKKSRKELRRENKQDRINYEIKLSNYKNSIIL